MILGQASATLTATATPGGGASALLFHASEAHGLVEAGATEPGYLEELRDYRIAPVTLSGSSGQSVWPGAGGVQVLRYRVLVAGEELEADRRLPDLQVTTRLGRPSSWSLTVPLDTWWPAVTTSPLGTIISRNGPPPGLDEVAVELLHVVGSEVLVYPLVTRGVVLRATEDRGSGTLEISGLGPDGRHDDEIVAFTGQGARSDILATLAESAAVPAAAVSDTLRGSQTADIQVVDEPFRPAADRLARPEGRVIHWTRDAELQTPPAVVTSGLDWTLTLEQLVSLPSESSTNPAPGKVIVTGVRQLPREGGRCGLRTIIRTLEAFDDSFQPPFAVSQQDSLGNVTPLGSAPPTRRHRVRRQIIRESRRCDSLVYREVTTYAWVNPEKAVKRITDILGNTAFNPCFLDADGTGRLLPRATFDRISRQQLIRTFRLTGSKQRLGDERTIEEAYRNPRHAIRTRSSTSTPWESSDWIPGTEVLASGDGVRDLVEPYERQLDRQTTYYHAPDDVDWRIEEVESGYRVRRGSSHLYHGGEEGRESLEAFDVVRRRDRQWSQVTEGVASLITTSIEADGNQTSAVEDVASLPRSEVLQTAATAPPETQVIRGSYNTRLAPWRTVRDQTLSDDYATSEAELAAIAETEAQLGAAATVRFAALPHGGLREGSVGVLDLGETQIRVHVQEVRYSESGGLMQVTANRYLL